MFRLDIVECNFLQKINFSERNLFWGWEGLSGPLFGSTPHFHWLQPDVKSDMVVTCSRHGNTIQSRDSMTVIMPSFIPKKNDNIQNKLISLSHSRICLYYTTASQQRFNKHYGELHHLTILCFILIDTPHIQTIGVPIP